VTPTAVEEADLVSVVIPARKEEGFTSECLLAVRKQDHRNLQIIVVDGGSPDGTLELVKAQIAVDKRVDCCTTPDRAFPPC